MSSCVSGCVGMLDSPYSIHHHPPRPLLLFSPPLIATRCLLFLFSSSSVSTLSSHRSPLPSFPPPFFLLLVLISFESIRFPFPCLGLDSPPLPPPLAIPCLLQPASRKNCEGKRKEGSTRPFPSQCDHLVGVCVYSPPISCLPFPCPPLPRHWTV